MADQFPFTHGVVEQNKGVAKEIVPLWRKWQKRGIMPGVQQ